AGLSIFPSVSASSIKASRSMSASTFFQVSDNSACIKTPIVRLHPIRKSQKMGTPATKAAKYEIGLNPFALGREEFSCTATTAGDFLFIDPESLSELIDISGCDRDLWIERHQTQVGSVHLGREWLDIGARRDPAALAQ